MMLGSLCSPCCGDDPCFANIVPSLSSVSLTISAYNSSLCQGRQNQFATSLATDNFCFDGDTTYNGTHILDVQSETETQYILASPTLQNLSSSCINEGKIFCVIYKSPPPATFSGVKAFATTPGITTGGSYAGQLIGSFFIPITAATFFDPPTRDANGAHGFYNWLTDPAPQCLRETVIPHAGSGQVVLGEWSEDQIEDAYASRTYLWRCDLGCVTNAFGARALVADDYVTFPSSPTRVPPNFQIFSTLINAANMWNFSGPSVAPQVTAVTAS